MGSPAVTQRLVCCQALKDTHNSDHYAIATTLILNAAEAITAPRRQWDKLDKKIFQETLTENLPPQLPPDPKVLDIERQMTSITDAIQTAIQTAVPVSRPGKWSKSGFGPEAKETIRKVNRARRRWQ